MAFNVADLFEHAVDAVPDRIAIICGDRQVTYRELDARANRLAHHLAAQGVGAGDHVGVYSRNSIEALETMIATYKLRAISVSVNFRYTADEVRYIVDNADMVALIHERRYSDIVAEVLPHTPKLTDVIVVEDGSDADYSRYNGVGYNEALDAHSPERDFGERSSDDIYILYTGGTTGFPKGVMWRHEDVWRALGGGINHVTGEYVKDEWELANQAKQSPVGIVMAPLSPLIHGAAQWAAFIGLNSGGTIVFIPQFDADEVWRLVEKHRVNAFTVVGDAMAKPLLDAYQAGSYDTSSVWSISSHAALFSHSLKQQYVETFPNVFITDVIGSSESGGTGLGVVSKDSDHSQGPRVKFSAHAALIDDDGKLVEPKPGAVGRMARTGHVPIGYYKDPEKTKTIFVEVEGKRYVVPGDYARYEDDGTVTLLGRGSECINTGGEKVFPEEVEGALRSHPDVFDALVIGVKDERFGQAVAALVQPRSGSTLDLAGLDAHVRTKVAGYKAPRTYWIVDEMMRQPSGKANYPAAKKYAADHADLARQAR
ncbi:acyl-CoA synthetase [Nocardia rhizosphaerihabitans]|uniref:Acyl-CoA synthetase n=1 Tax=Nocardia rhizosphaerihabitans TaxID=1691570 RepID=A0ABQ2K8K2_9NOCA|nr:acyl-CoA synthetase [Nocardia rhizosphaerihabitans]GGN71986.1 acyl-CoA synthetase [Nocardia rhizosphaerihabitans]